MANFLREHKLNINRKLIIPRYQLQKGMIVSGKYNSQDNESGECVGQTINESSDYVILVLQPNYEGKLHGLSLAEVDLGTIKDLAKDIGTTIIRSNRFRTLQIPKLEMYSSSKRFYSSKLKATMESQWNNSYRTFDLKNFTSLMLLDYKF